MKRNLTFAAILRFVFIVIALSTRFLTVYSQSQIPLTNLSFFQNPTSNWKIAGNINASLNESNMLSVSQGTGILVNLPDKQNPGKDLFTSIQHGDMDLELDYMMAKGS